MFTRALYAYVVQCTYKQIALHTTLNIKKAFLYYNIFPISSKYINRVNNKANTCIYIIHDIFWVSFFFTYASLMSCTVVFHCCMYVYNVCTLGLFWCQKKRRRKNINKKILLCLKKISYCCPSCTFLVPNVNKNVSFVSTCKLFLSI